MSQMSRAFRAEHPHLRSQRWRLATCAEINRCPPQTLGLTTLKGAWPR
jgi:hypothetical protein